MNNLIIFVIRAILSAAFAVVLGRVFFSDANPAGIAGFGVLLLAGGYLADFLRNRKGE